MNRARLSYVDPDKLQRNPENPRLIFRPDELDILLDSIKKEGIIVPLSIYEEKNRYVLLDGERRWLCAKKLNLREVPAIIEPKPTQLENILRMFNIHNVRIQWDLFAIALKLKKVENLLEKEKKPRSIRDLAAVTGVSQSTVKRAFGLLELPSKYQKLLVQELKKPKSEQQFTEDFFIEMLKAIRTIENYIPQVINETPKEKIMDKFLNKYKTRVITNIVKFRDVSKIARSEKANISANEVIPIITRLIHDPTYKIETAYNESVARAYEERSLKRTIDFLIERLEEIKNISDLDVEVIKRLKILNRIIQPFLK